MANFTRTATIALGFLLFACGGGAPPPEVHDAKNDALYQARLKQRNDLSAEFKAAPADFRKRCEIQAGDCRLDVKDGRDKVLRKHQMLECKSTADTDAEFACVAEKLEARGETAEASEYYKLDAWCLERLVACTAKLADDARGDAKRALAASRRDHITSSKRGLAARSQLEFAEEKVEYLRAMLPPQADGVCPVNPELDKCRAHAQDLAKDFEHELEKAEGSYSESAAFAAYEARHAADAACHEPAFKCLRAKLDGFGGTNETRAYMAQTLKALERRSHLVAERGDDEARSCLDRGLSQFQGRIIGDYQRFSHEPVLFFQAQLHRDFRALYEAQSGCLQSRARASSPDASAAVQPASPKGSRQN